MLSLLLKLKSMILLLIFVISSFLSSEAFKESHCAPGRSVIVHLFEWKWSDIEAECVRFLGPKGYCGVQVSPANEHAVIYASGGRNQPWWQRYQPVSYKLHSRSGNETEFKKMVRTCNNHNVRIYVDAVINHMGRNNGRNNRGSGGSWYNASSLSFPAVPFNSSSFSDCAKCSTDDCNIHDYGDANQVRDCWLLGLPDLDNSKDSVQKKIANFFNNMIDVGVAGFRIDAAKHMWPEDVLKIINRLDNLNRQWFAPNSKPFIFQEVIDHGHEPIKGSDYLRSGIVTEFKYGLQIGKHFKNIDGAKISQLKTLGPNWGLLSSDDALVFVDNHDNQRGHGGGGNVVTFYDAKLYKMAVSFMLAWPYGVPRVMSSYSWQGGPRRNDWIGPPHDRNYTITTVQTNSDGTGCLDRWVCEHRWRQIANMIEWRASASSESVQHWWSNLGNQIAFSRGSRAFIAMNNRDGEMKKDLMTGLPEGIYCDVNSGARVANGEGGWRCTGKRIEVKSDGRAEIEINGRDQDPVIAIHQGSKL